MPKGKPMPEPRTIHVAANGGIPNNPTLPAVVMAGALADPSESGARRLLEENGWGGTWRWSVYDFHHYHPASHEVLVCVSGSAKLRIGGPEGEDIEVSPGDTLVLPAGVGHKRLSSSPDFAVVGAYPPGQESPEIIKASELPEEEAAERIAATPLPDTDPVEGADGTLLRFWGG